MIRHERHYLISIGVPLVLILDPGEGFIRFDRNVEDRPISCSHIPCLSYARGLNGFYSFTVDVNQRGSMTLRYNQKGNNVAGVIYDAGNEYCFSGIVNPYQKLIINNITGDYLGVRLFDLRKLQRIPFEYSSDPLVRRFEESCLKK